MICWIFSALTVILNKKGIKLQKGNIPKSRGDIILNRRYH